MRVQPIKKREIQTKIEMYLKAKSDRNYVIWLVGTGTGLRIGDIIDLKVSDVQGNILTVKEKKTGKTKEVKLTTKLKKALTKYIDKFALKSTDYLFASRQNNKISVRQVQRIIKSLSNKLSIDVNVNTHSMRKTYAYNIYVASNQNITLVMEALNHSNMSVTRRYLGLDTDDIFNILEAM